MDASEIHVIKCSRAEVFDILSSRCFPSRWSPQTGNRTLAIGRACPGTSGRFLAVVVVVDSAGLHPLTCYSIGLKAKRKYLGWLSSTKP
jgi:hypothetical protein